MAEANDRQGGIYQNLIDAGCDIQKTERCMPFLKEGEILRMLPVLSEYRAALLNSVHIGQKQIDCLDFLIYKLNKNEKEI